MQTLMRNAKWAGLSVVLASGAAYGSFLPTFSNTTPGPSTNTTFNYALVFATTAGASAERLDPGDFVTLYDIQGFVSASAPAGFNVSTQNVGINGFGTAPTDSPALSNVTFTYTGASISADTIFSGLSLVSSFGATTVGQFTSEDTSNAAGTSGLPIGQIGPITLPTGGGVIPEPASLLSLGAFGIFSSLRRRR